MGPAMPRGLYWLAGAPTVTYFAQVTQLLITIMCITRLPMVVLLSDCWFPVVRGLADLEDCTACVARSQSQA